MTGSLSQRTSTIDRALRLAGELHEVMQDLFEEPGVDPQALQRLRGSTARCQRHPVFNRIQSPHGSLRIYSIRSVETE
jgi:hypothetical protein